MLLLCLTCRQREDVTCMYIVPMLTNSSGVLGEGGRRRGEAGRGVVKASINL